ncbi:hypothetical protein L484_021964 [Morus notabilis]|uniref:DUF4283 domain-containing protein n=1 Tax=Morus notabilis TaxID=981085 RepID=W9R914_9ROSA|nr:hypothetical protein L484_021964 [Morus notabilis]
MTSPRKGLFGSVIEITERNINENFLLEVDLGGAALLCKAVDKVLNEGKGNDSRRFYRGHSYRMIVECSRNKGGDFMKISKIQNRIIRNVTVLGEYAYKGWYKLETSWRVIKNSLESRLRRTIEIEARNSWIGIEGLMLNLWNYHTLKVIGDACEGLLEIAKDTLNQMFLSSSTLIVPPLLLKEILNSKETLEKEKEEQERISHAPKFNASVGLAMQMDNRFEALSLLQLYDEEVECQSENTLNTKIGCPRKKAEEINNSPLDLGLECSSKPQRPNYVQRALDKEKESASHTNPTTYSALCLGLDFNRRVEPFSGSKWNC